MKCIKENNIKVLFIITTVLSVLIALYTTITLGQALIHTDSTTGNMYCKSVLSTGSLFPKTWNFNNADIQAFGIITLSALFHSLINNTIIARVIASAVCLCIAIASIYWISKDVFKNNAYIISIPLLLVILNGTTYRDEIFFQAAYTPYIVTLTFCFCLIYRIFFSEDYSCFHVIVLGCLLCVFMLRGLRDIAEFVLPTIITIVIDRLLTYKEEKKISIKKDLIKITLCLVLPVLLGILWYKYIYYTRFTHMHPTTTSQISLNLSTISEVGNGLKQIFMNLFSIFGVLDASSLIKKTLLVALALLVFWVFPILQLSLYRTLDRAEKTYTIFGLIHNIILLSAILLGGKLYERYLLSSVFVAVIISSNYLSMLLEKKMKMANVISLILIILALFNITNMYKKTVGWRDMVAEQKEVCQQLIDAGITKVYGSYWLAYPQEMYSNNKLTAGGVSITERGMEKYYRLVDDSAFEKKEGKSCVILREDEAELYPHALYNSCGQWDDDFVIKDAWVSDNAEYWKSDLIVYVYNEDIGNRLSDGFRDGIIDIKEMSFNWYGTMTDEYILLEENGLIHGPLSYLSAGQYSMRIVGEDLVGCDCSVISDNTPNNVVYVIKDIQENYIDIDVTVKAGVEDLQVYVGNFVPNKQAKFYEIIIN